MEPKEKAKELIYKFRFLVQTWDTYWDAPRDEELILKDAKDCALIVVNEIIEQWEYIDTYIADLRGELNPNLKYWYEVKTEIEKL